MSVLTTPITELFNIKHPIILAGMDRAAGPELAAAVTNAGGLGVIGGFGYHPRALRLLIQEIKKNLTDPNAPFGVDLLLPQVGGNARKTNVDYTNGQLPKLIDVLIEEKAALFVSAVGVPPTWVVEKLHKHGILVMNMVGHPKHVPKALAAGVDLICAQAGEAGGHTGEIPASILIPSCVDAVKGYRSPLTGKPIYVVGAGAVVDGRGLAANLVWGAQAVWVGTRFVASVESSAAERHKELLVSAGVDDTIRTAALTGRPARLRKTPYYEKWETERKEEMNNLLSKGIVPRNHDLDKHPEKLQESMFYAMGMAAGRIDEILPARVIVDNIVNEAIRVLQAASYQINTKAWYIVNTKKSTPAAKL